MSCEQIKKCKYRGTSRHLWTALPSHLVAPLRKASGEQGHAKNPNLTARMSRTAVGLTSVSAEKLGKEVKPKCHPRGAELRPQQGGGHPFGASSRAWWTGGRMASQLSGEASVAQLFSTSTQSKGPPVTTKCHHRHTSAPCVPQV